MSNQMTRDAILAGKYHGSNGPYYDRHIKPLCEAREREKAAAAVRAIRAASPRARRAAAPYGDTCHGVPVTSEEIDALVGEP